MGYETIQGKNGKIKLWNTVVDSIEGEFESCIQLIGYLEKKHNQPYTKDQVMHWMESCEKSPSEDEFFKGMMRISVEDIMKYGTKVELKKK